MKNLLTDISRIKFDLKLKKSEIFELIKTCRILNIIESIEINEQLNLKKTLTIQLIDSYINDKRGEYDSLINFKQFIENHFHTILLYPHGSIDDRLKHTINEFYFKNELKSLNILDLYYCFIDNYFEIFERHESQDGVYDVFMPNRFWDHFIIQLKDYVIKEIKNKEIERNEKRKNTEASIVYKYFHLTNFVKYRDSITKKDSKFSRILNDYCDDYNNNLLIERIISDSTIMKFIKKYSFTFPKKIRDLKKPSLMGMKMNLRDINCIPTNT